MMLDDDGAVYAVRDAYMQFESFSYPELPNKVFGNIAQFMSSILTSSVRFNGSGWKANIQFMLRNNCSFSFHDDSVYVLMEDGDV